MKTLKLLVTVLITGVCAVGVHAQKQLRYVPQALKGAKAVPYVVKPKLPVTVRMDLSVPVLRPQVAVAAARPNVATSANVSTAVERQVAKKVTVEERMARLEANLAWLEKYARTHNNKLPQVGDVNYLRVSQALEDVSSSHSSDMSPFRRRYNQLIGAEDKQIRKEIREGKRQWEQEEWKQKEWDQLLQQDEAWKVQPEDIIIDPAENADKAAAMGEEQIAFPGTVTTDEYINQLLRFYNQLDPLGTGTIR